MQTILVVLQVVIAIALVGVVLVQRSEGGGLGMGSAGMSGFLSGRGQANLLTRVTAGLATAFMVVSLALALVSREAARPSSIMDGTTAPASESSAGTAEPVAPEPAEPTVPVAE
ncbi:MAG: preprotein translocase subunit SecG [Alphaproteobacteria bacterium]